MPPLIAFAGALGGLAVVRWAYRTALRSTGNWKKRGWRASRKRPDRARSRRCAGTPPPALTGPADIRRIGLNRTSVRWVGTEVLFSLF